MVFFTEVPGTLHRYLAGYKPSILLCFGYEWAVSRYKYDTSARSGCDFNKLPEKGSIRNTFGPFLYESFPCSAIKNLGHFVKNKIYQCTC